MTEFGLQAPFKPTGDQPQAIAQLAAGVNSGLQFQTLLGATGTGKSLGHDDPVFVVEKRGLQTQPRVLPIGELIDTLIAQLSEKVCQHEDTLILDADSALVEYYAQSFNPETSAVGLYKIRSFIRHNAPSKMYHLQTACGRSATLTGDHNLWVLRDGQLQLIKTAEARETDYVPLPEKLLADGNLQTLDTLSVLSGKRLFVEAPEAILTYGRKAEGRRQKAEGNTLIAKLNLTPEFLRLIGYYIADGNQIANRNEIVRQDIEAILSQLGIPLSVRPSSDYQISSTALAELFASLCGKTAKDKHLPDFWTQLPTANLGQLLQAYFDGDGTVDKSSAVTVTTASQRLASELVYALLRFGIWARIACTWKRSTNSQHTGDWYYQVCVSGQADLQKFQQCIGFSIPYKEVALAAQLQHTEHSNVDVVAINGEQLRWLRNQLGISAKLLGERSGISRSGVQMFETGKRRPKRIVLLKLLATLRDLAMKKNSLTPQWWQIWKAMEQLCKLRWTPIATVKEVEYQHPYVYDFCVPGAETFLAGTGGFFVHNTFTIASVINQIKKPTLVLAHNKTLAAQLCNELRDFFPNNAVEYFVSYYDYYQPEAYIPVSDTYIEKTASINDEIDMLRHSATRSLFERRDVIVVASISCIYGLGIPAEYLKAAIPLQVGREVNQRQILRDLASIQYSRNDLEMGRGRFRVRGDVLEIGPAYEDRIIRVEFFGDEIDAVRYVDPVTGEIIKSLEAVNIYPARHFVTPEERLEDACDAIAAELKERKAQLESAGKLLEAQRIDQRTRYDLEMLREVGYCNGVENYSRHLAGRIAGEPPECLIDYFPKDWLLVIDESHVTVPQIRGMYNGDQARKHVLIEHGFRLPSAADNRPLKAEEFWEKVNQCIFVSATPGNWELELSEGQVAEQIIRPTGVVDPEIMVRPTEGQIDDLLGEIKDRVDRQERVLITTLTKRMAEDLTEYLQDNGIRVRYLHSEINSIQRIEILQDLRDGEFDVLVGVNLLREGLDLPEVSLVAILDADKEGFLRAERSLIQTIGRAARHVRGQAIMYADNLTDSMIKAIEETDRRRGIQTAYNRLHGITPQSIVKKKSSNAILSFLEVSRRLNATDLEVVDKHIDELPLEEIPDLITRLEVQMKEAAKKLEFEEAAKLRDRIKHLRDKLVGR